MVNIPSTTILDNFKLRVSWFDATNTLISFQSFKVYTAPTSGWDQAVASLVAPAGTTYAQMQMIFEGLNGTFYADDLVFQQQ